MSHGYTYTLPALGPVSGCNCFNQTAARFVGTSKGVVVDKTVAAERAETLFVCRTDRSTDICTSANGGAAVLLSPSASTKAADVPSPMSHTPTPIWALLMVVIATTTAAWGVGLGALASEVGTLYGGVANVPPSPNSHTLAPIRALQAAVNPTSGGVHSTTTITGFTSSGEVHVTNARFTASNDSPSTGERINMDAGSTLRGGLLAFVRFVLPLWALPLLALRRMRSWRRARLPAQRMPRRRPVFRTIGGYWAVILLLGGEVGQHLLFVGAVPNGILTDAEFKEASWGTLF